MIPLSKKALAVIALGLSCIPPFSLRAEDPGTELAPISKKEVHYLKQGWSPEIRQSFYHLTQGSQLIPYEWFLAVEQAKGQDLFRKNENLNRFGYITQAPNAAENPDGLPIGFAKDDNPLTVQELYETKRGFLGEKYQRDEYPRTNSWLGLTCAACHTSEIYFNNQIIRVDGAPSMANHELFMAELVAALKAADEDDEKFTRFAKGVLDTNYKVLEANQLRKELRAYTEVLDLLIKRNAVAELPYGYARLDAFGAILNEVSERALGIAANHRPSSAPVSYPVLWDTPHLDWVQWNGSAANPIARNVGEVLGVYGQLKLQGTPATGQFQSTANLRNLFQLETWISSLEAPPWPAEILGPIDTKLAKLGESLFTANCAKCHHLRDEGGEFPLTREGLIPNAPIKGLIKTVMVHQEKIGTDPQMVLNFADRKGQPGDLKTHLPPDRQHLPEVPAALLLTYAVRGAIGLKLAELRPPLTEPQLGALTGYRLPGIKPPVPKGYKARPLNGIWATGPYLHNGSVPNLYQLLLPEEERVKRFYVGSKQFDPKRVGFSTKKVPASSEFCVVDQDGRIIPGNSNKGHCGPFYTQTRRETGFRNFADKERWALIEFMKTLE